MPVRHKKHILALVFKHYETNTPASTATSVVRKYKTKELIDFLRKEEDLELSGKVFEILEKEEITGRAFLKLTEEKLI
ncbi:hypothetical protein C1645_773775, partial [Glomus cerebriforme]